LLAQYQKLHAELQTVKQAYITSQEKVNGVEAVVKDKEVVLRLSVEENDMLTFNNQRLTKRVEQLMMQLQEEKSKSNSSWGGFFSGAKVEIARLKDDMEVSREQLSRTLEENESLVSQMLALQEENEEAVKQLEYSLGDADRTSREQNEVLAMNVQECDAAIMELTDEKNSYVAKVGQMESEKEATRAFMSEREQTMTSINRQLSSDLEHTQHLYDHKVAFDDTKAPPSPKSISDFTVTAFLIKQAKA